MKRLRAGPFLDSYRGLSIVHTRQYSLETGAPPRDLLRRRTRVAEYYRIPWSDDFMGQSLVIHAAGAPAAAHLRHHAENETFGNQILIDLYDESKDTFFTITWQELLLHAALDEEDRCEMLNSLRGNNAVDEHTHLTEAAAAALPAHPMDKTNMYVHENQAAAGAHTGPTLFLQDNPVPIEYQNHGVMYGELRTFYRQSGLFPVGNAYMRGFEHSHLVNQVTNDLANSLGHAPNWGPPVAGVPPAENTRKAFFTQLMLGYSEDNAGNRAFNGFVYNIGMRPNLHVGRMVNTFVKPHAPRFVHIAAQIFSQVSHIK